MNAPITVLRDGDVRVAIREAEDSYSFSLWKAYRDRQGRLHDTTILSLKEVDDAIRLLQEAKREALGLLKNRRLDEWGDENGG